MAQDPVCSMEIENVITAPAFVYKSKTYYFCSDLCKIQFEQDPEKFIKNSESDEHKHHHH